MEWIQAYDPLQHVWLSTLAAAVPIVLLLVTLGVFEWKAHWAALTGLLAALAVSVGLYGIPAVTALGGAVDGAAYGLFPIGRMVVNAVFLYNLTVAAGRRRPKPLPRVEVEYYFDAGEPEAVCAVSDARLAVANQVNNHGCA